MSFKTKQSFSYTGSSTYTIDNVVLSSSAIALFDTSTGVGGVDYIPYDGATVTVVAGDVLSDYRQLAPTLNNKLYYLVSDTAYTAADKTTILSLATEIPVVYSAGVFTGTFTFLNPNNYEYVYLLWDYEDKMDTVASYSGVTDSRAIDMNYGTNIGRAGISFNTIDPDQPTRYQIEWNGEIVADTKYVGLNSSANYIKLEAAGIPAEDIGLVAPYDGLVNNGTGIIEFYKNLPEGEARLIVSSAASSSTWIVNKINPYLTEFYIDETAGTIANVCSKSPTYELWHNGVDLLPNIGDKIFIDPAGTDVYVGDEYLHLMDSPIVASATEYITISSTGEVLSKESCTCSEFAVPFIIADPITMTTNTIESVTIDTINNPTSWTVSSSSLPDQAVFSNGTIYFDNCPAGIYSIELSAENCLGRSLVVTISVTVSDPGNMKPFLIDVEQFKESGSDACLVIPTFTLMYFDGDGYIPNLTDAVFYDSEGKRPFMGGKKWYQINDSDYSIQIDQEGTIIGKSTCPGTTTTTTTTSTTTLPSGTYFTAVSCADNTTTVVLRNSLGTSITTNLVVKTTDGNCWRVTGSTTAKFPYYNVVTPIVTYADCTACTGTTTTTSTTTTTTSTPVTGFDFDVTGFNTNVLACTSTPTYVTYYHTGTLAVNSFVYTDAGATTLFDGAFLWYLVRKSGITYACLIADTGQVLKLLACSGVTTTTTTTTIPTYYYSVENCTDLTSDVLRYIGFEALAINTYVKGSNGKCYRIKGNVPPGAYTADIYYTYSSCSECAATTTTTTTTTTSTTTTTTTSTTTTTITPLTPITLSYSSSQSTVCSILDIDNYYVNGAIGVPGNYIFTDLLGVSLAPSGWYLNLIINVAYEWNGSNWTGATKVC